MIHLDILQAVMLEWEPEPGDTEPQLRGQDFTKLTDRLWSRFEEIGNSPERMREAFRTFDTTNPLVVAEQLIRSHFKTVLRIPYFTLDDFDSFEAQLISVEGHMGVVLDEKLPIERRIYYHYHVAGHLANGHISAGTMDQPHVRYEVPSREDMPHETLSQELGADRWAIEVTNKPLNPNNPLTNSVRNAIIGNVDQILANREVDLDKPLDQRLRNLSIVRRVENIIRERSNPESEALENVFEEQDIKVREQMIRLRNKIDSQEVELSQSNRPLNVNLSSFKSHDAIDGASPGDLLTTFSKGLALPLIVIQVGDNSLNLPVSSPYGRLPEYAIDNANSLFYLRNFFIFDALGHGYKLELVHDFTEMAGDDPRGFLEESIGLNQAAMKRVPELPQVLSDDDSRIIALEADDYQRIHNILALIEAGEFQ